MNSRRPHSHFRFLQLVPRQMGLTLVELMVAITIGLIVTAAVAQIFASSRATYTLEEGLARVQENGRFAVEFLAYDLRMAGYTGCNSKLPATSIRNNVAGADESTTMMTGGLRGYQYTGAGGPSNNLRTDWTPTLPAGFFGDGEVSPRTDVIVVQYGSAVDTNLTGNMLTEDAQIRIATTAATRLKIDTGDVLMVSDCLNADIFRANNTGGGAVTTTIAHPASVNTTIFLSKRYTTDAQFMKLVSHAYYIAPSADNQQPALFRKELVRTGPPAIVELVQGIEDMRLVYAEDTDGNGVPDIYRAPGTVANWTDVIGVRVGVLARTPSVTAGQDQNPYELAGITVPAKNDNFRRHAFNATIQFRN